MPDDLHRVFNGAVEVGLRTLAILSHAYPVPMSLQRLVVFDYLSVHSDDVEDGPPGLHPRTPYRSSELLVRREVLRSGLVLYQSRGLASPQYLDNGVFFVASDKAGSFLDAFNSLYVEQLRQRAAWVVTAFESHDDAELYTYVEERLGSWGAEFALSSTLWSRDGHE